MLEHVKSEYLPDGTFQTTLRFRCDKCKNTKGLRKLLVWRVLHKWFCETNRTYQRVKKGDITGLSSSTLLPGIGSKIPRIPTPEVDDET